MKHLTRTHLTFRPLLERCCGSVFSRSPRQLGRVLLATLFFWGNFASNTLGEDFATNTVLLFTPQELAVLAPGPDPQASLAVVTNSPFGQSSALRVETAVGLDFLKVPLRPQGSNDLWIVMDACYDGDQAGTIHLRFLSRGETSPRLFASVLLFPRLPTRIAIPLSVLDAQTVLPSRTPLRMKATITGRRLPRTELSDVSMALTETRGKQRLFLSSLRVTSSEPPYPAAKQVVVDPLGQWLQHDWEGRSTSEAAMVQQLRAARVQSGEVSFPEGWNQHGAFRGRQFPTNSYFHAETDGKRWWLVDPEGFAFFSLGLNSVRPGEETLLLPGMENLCQWLPEQYGAFAETIDELPGGGFAVDFPRANLVRVFGKSWRSDWTSLVRGRLLSWRFNTLGARSDLELVRTIRLPYVLELGPFPSTSTRLFRDFPDVYSPEYLAAAKVFAKGLETVKTDPLLVGYFLGYEPQWARGRVNLASEMLETNPGTHTRRMLAAWVRDRYQDRPSEWARAWEERLEDFDQLVTSTFENLADSSASAREDLWEFSRQMVRQYVGVVCDETKKADPHHMNLGMRYDGIPSDLVYEGVDRFDVFSVNCYEMQPPVEALRAVTRRTGRPVLISGFRFGALDRGLPSTGPCAVSSQEDRAVAYRRYVELAADSPFIVGVHYSSLYDQPLLGGQIGENYQIGFVDVCHQPYAELVDQARRAHESVYEIMLGKRKPFKVKASPAVPVQ